MAEEDVQELAPLSKVGSASFEEVSSGGKIKGMALFLKAAMTNPRAVGACFPSSLRMGRVIAEQIKREKDQIVVEVGAGTGVITQALLDSGLDKEKLLVIERDPKLAAYLRDKFPYLRVIQGDAAELSRYVEGSEVATVVSGLPLLSLPRDIVRKVGQQFLEVLGEKGQLIQFTYRVSKKTSPLPKGFRRISFHKIWRNLPPARVEVYQYQQV